MLAASCRVCVACRQPIDLAKISSPRAASSVEPVAVPSRDRVPFPWAIFFVVFLITQVLFSVAFHYWGLMKTEVLIGLIEVVTSGWVFYDAPRRHVPKPLRWGLGSLFLWAIFFPWYLARRRLPQATCPWVEEGPMVRLVVLVLLVAFLFAAIVAALQKLPK